MGVRVTPPREIGLLKHDNVDTKLRNKPCSTALGVVRNFDVHEIPECLEEYANVCFVSPRGRSKEQTQGGTDRFGSNVFRNEVTEKIHASA